MYDSWEQYLIEDAIDRLRLDPDQVEFEFPENDSHSIICIEPDGTRTLYDSLTKTSQNVTRKREIDTEEKWRQEFGWQLERVMIKHGMGQVELSELSGISQSAISSYLCGRKTPSAYNVSKLEKTLHCRKGELMSMV